VCYSTSGAGRETCRRLTRPTTGTAVTGLLTRTRHNTMMALNFAEELRHTETMEGEINIKHRTY